MVDIQAVIFDMGGVLLYVFEAGRFRAIEARLGLEAGRLPALLWGHEDWHLAERGAITDVEYWRRAALRLGLSTAEDLAWLQAELFGHLSLDTRMVALVRALRRRYRTALLSNASDVVGTPEWRARFGVDGLFDVEIISAHVCLAKPDEAIYQLALDRLGVVAEAAVFIDDHRPNVDGAAAAGLHAIHFTGYEALLAALGELGVRAEG